jgi:hypothetical protein
MSKRIGKFTKIYIDDSGGDAREITNDVSDIPGLPLTYDEVEVSGYGQDKQYLAGQGDVQISIEMQFTTTANTGTHTVFSGIVGDNTGHTLTVQIGANAAPTTGDPEFEGEFLVTSYEVKPARAGSVTATAQLRIADGESLPAWGSVS